MALISRNKRPPTWYWLPRGLLALAAPLIGIVLGIAYSTLSAAPELPNRHRMAVVHTAMLGVLWLEIQRDYRKGASDDDLMARIRSYEKGLSLLEQHADRRLMAATVFVAANALVAERLAAHNSEMAADHWDKAVRWCERLRWRHCGRERIVSDAKQLLSEGSE